MYCGVDTGSPQLICTPANCQVPWVDWLVNDRERKNTTSWFELPIPGLKHRVQAIHTHTHRQRSSFVIATLNGPVVFVVDSLHTLCSLQSDNQLANCNNCMAVPNNHILRYLTGVCRYAPPPLPHRGERYRGVWFGGGVGVMNMHLKFPVADPEGFPRFPLKPPFYLGNLHFQLHARVCFNTSLTSSRSEHAPPPCGQIRNSLDS